MVRAGKARLEVAIPRERLLSEEGNPTSPMKDAAAHMDDVSFIHVASDGQTVRPGVGVISSFWNVTKMSIGIGMLTFPYAFKEAGFGIAAVTLVAMGFLSMNAVLILSSAQRHVKVFLGTEAVSYTDTVEVVLGKKWRNATAFFILLSQIGVSIGYEIFVCNTFATYFEALSYGGWLLVLQPPLIIFCSFRSLRWLSIISFMGLLCLWLGYGSSMWLMSQDISERGWAPLEPVTDIEHYVVFIGLSALAFEGLACVALTIEQSMSKPEKFPQVVCTAIAFITVLECSFAVLGCFSFGGNIDEIITRTFPKSLCGTVVSIVFSLELLFTFPGNLYPVWKFLEELAFGPKPAHLRDAPTPKLSRLIWEPNADDNRERIGRTVTGTLLRTTVVLAMGVVAFYFRNSFAKFLSVTGSVACASVIFLIPARLQLELVERFSRAWFSALLLLMVGTLAPIVGILTALSLV